MLNLTRPKYFIPVHGEYRHLVLHCRLAEDVGIARRNVILTQNGQCVSFSSSGVKKYDLGCTGRVLIDGKGIGDVGRSVLRERRMLSEEGLVVVNMAFDEETGIVVYGPQLVSRGFVFETATGHVVEDAQCVILEIVEEISPDTPDRIELMRAKVQTALRQYFFYTIGRKPIILPFFIET